MKSLLLSFLGLASVLAATQTTFAPPFLGTVQLAPILGQVQAAPNGTLLSNTFSNRRHLLASATLGRSLLASSAPASAAAVAFSGYRGAEGSSLTFRASPADPALSYRWDFGDGSTADGALAHHTYANDGNYKVVLTAALGNETVELDTRALISNVAPTNFSIAAVSGRLAAVNTSLTFALSAFDPSSADVLSFLVDFGDGSPAEKVTASLDSALGRHAATVSHAYSEPGSYVTRLLTVFDDAAAVPVAESKVSVLSVALDQNAYSVNQGYSVSLSLVPTDLSGLVASVAWTLGDGATANGTSVRHIYRRPAVYPVTATIQGLEGESVVLRTAVTVAEVAPDRFTLTSDRTLIAAGANVSFSAGARWPGDEGLSLVLDFGDDSAPQTLPALPLDPGTVTPSELVWGANVSHRFERPGVYTARLVQAVSPTSTVTIASLTVTVTAVALTPALAHGSEGSTLTFLALPAQAAVEFSWSFGDGSAPFAGPNATHVYTDMGTYNVTLTARDPKSGESVAIEGQAVVANSLPTAFTLSASRRLVPADGQIEVSVSGRDYGSVPIAFLVQVALVGSTAPPQRLLLVGAKSADVPRDQLAGGALWTAQTSFSFPQAGSYHITLLEAFDRGAEVEVASLEVSVFSIGFAIDGSDYVVEMPPALPSPASEAEPADPMRSFIDGLDTIHSGLLTAVARKLLREM